MNKNLITKIGGKIGKVAKNSWKYLPIGISIDYLKKDIDLEDPKQDFTFRLRSIYSTIPILILIAYLCNGITNKRWDLDYYKGKLKDNIEMVKDIINK